MKRFKIDQRYIAINLSRAIIVSMFLVGYCLYLTIDNFVHGTPAVGRVAFLCGILTAVSTTIFSVCKRRNKPNGVLVHIGILIQCLVYWGVYAYFLYTGGTGGTSIFLIFNAAPATLFFFNLVYGAGFCFVTFVGMAVYMLTPLHLSGYQFPEMYYQRLPMMYLIEVITCAVAQYTAVRAEIKQDMAIEEARRADAAKSEFLANTSHEIRTPINAVLGMNEMILRESDLAESSSDADAAALQASFRKIRGYAANVEIAGNNLLAIINDILDFSGMEGGRLDIREGDYRLSSVLNDVCNIIHFKAREKDLYFVADVDETLPDSLWGDEVRVRQIIINLLSNAVKYTETGGVTLRVRKEATAISGTETVPESKTVLTDPDGRPVIRLVISVTDTGIGIKEVDIEKLFAKFGRVDLDKNSTIEGTGLGLAITKQLLEMMHGDVQVESEYGKGSTFTITLPQGVCDGAPVGDFQAVSARETGNRKTYREPFLAPEARVLAVDDTAMNLIVLEELLKQTQVQLFTASSGMRALEKTTETQFDLILMDHRMPQMDGTETLLRIRSQEGGQNTETPVVCLTADAVKGARERYLADGFSDYLSKPVDVLSLEAVLERFLPQDKVRRPEMTETDDDRRMPDQEASAARTPEKPADGQADGMLRTIYQNLDMLHLEDAMKYCMSEAVLEKTLKAFYETLPEYIDQIGRYYEQGDYENYTIKVHALKSSALLAGATELSKQAKTLETMGNTILETKKAGTQ